MYKVKNFNCLSSMDIKDSFENISYSVMAAAILPMYITLDLSSKTEPYIDKAKSIVKNICEILNSDRCPLDTFVVFSVIYNFKQKSDKPIVIYSGHIDGFDYDSFIDKINDTTGFCSFENVISQSRHYNNMLLNKLISKERIYTGTINILITDHIDELKISQLTSVNKNCMCNEINFIFTTDSAGSLSYGENNRFYIFDTIYDICEIIKALTIIHSPIDCCENYSVPPRSTFEDYNKYLCDIQSDSIRDYINRW